MRYIRLWILGLLSCLAATQAVAQSSPYSNVIFPTITITTSPFTSAPVRLNSTCCSGTRGSGFASATITVLGNALTTATFGILGSADNGLHYFPVPISPVLTPSTIASTVTVTANGMYQVNLAGLTHIEIVTSGTFTATNVQFLVTASPNAVISRVSSSSGGGASFPSEAAVVCSTSTTTSEPCSAASVASVLANATNCTGTNVYSPALNQCIPVAGTITPGAQVVTVYPAGSPSSAVTPSQMTTDPTFSDLNVRAFTAAKLNATANCDLFSTCAAAIAAGNTDNAIPVNSTSTEAFVLSNMAFSSNTMTLNPGIQTGGQVYDPRHGSTRYSVDSPIIDNAQLMNALGSTHEVKQVQFGNVGSAIFPQDLPNGPFLKTTQGSLLRTCTSYASGQNVCDGNYAYSYGGDADALGFGNFTSFASALTQENAPEGFHVGATKISEFPSNLVIALAATATKGATAVQTATLPGTPNVGQDRWAVDTSQQATSPCTISADGADSQLGVGIFTMSGGSCYPADTTLLLSATVPAPVADVVTSAVLSSGVVTVTLAAATRNNYSGVRTQLFGYAQDSPLSIPSYGPTTTLVDSTHFTYQLAGYANTTGGAGSAFPQSVGTQTITISTTGLPTDVTGSTTGLPSTGVAAVADANASVQYFELADYTVVDSTHITIAFHNPHTHPVLIGIGGYAGSIAIPNANIRPNAPNGNPTVATGALFDFQPLIGCKVGSGTCYTSVGQYDILNGEGAVTNTSVPLATITCAAGVNTVLTNAPFQALYTGLPLTIAGNSAINATNVIATFQSREQFTYSQACTAASGTGGTATFNNAQVTFAPSFRIYYVVNPSTGAIDGNFGTSAVSATMNAGDIIAFPNQAYPAGPSEFSTITQLTRGLNFAPEDGWGGQCNGLQGPTRACAHFSMNVGNPADYLGHGGANRLPGAGISVDGLYSTGMILEDGDLNGILHLGNSLGTDYAAEVFSTNGGGNSNLTVSWDTGVLTYNNIFAATGGMEVLPGNNNAGYDALNLLSQFNSGAGANVNFDCISCSAPGAITKIAQIVATEDFTFQGILHFRLATPNWVDAIQDVMTLSTTGLTLGTGGGLYQANLMLPGVWNTNSTCQLMTIGADATTGSKVGVQPCDVATITSGSITGATISKVNFGGTDIDMDLVESASANCSQVLFWTISGDSVHFGRPCAQPDMTALYKNSAVLFGVDDNAGFLHVTASNVQFGGNALLTAASTASALTSAAGGTFQPAAFTSGATVDVVVGTQTCHFVSGVLSGCS